jgi:hypothetical protein
VAHYLTELHVRKDERDEFEAIVAQRRRHRRPSHV